MLQVKLTGEYDVVPPKRETDGAAGYDIYAVTDCVIRPRCRTKIPTGLVFRIPDQHVGMLKTRSSMALMGIDVVGGVIDSDYRGEVAVILHNTSTKDYEVRIHQRIAQLVVLPVFTGAITVVDDLPSSRRGEGGFGSTGH